MSRSLNSPAGKLLRASRLFALPAPLPQPPMEVPSVRGIKYSDSATIPYPTHQAIATPKSLHARGDWGLKRPLPLKATRSSTPHIRVKAIDNFAHITDFESAADHTQSLAKWQEMNVVMRPRESRETISGSFNHAPKSAFDDATDNTALSTEEQTAGKTRWKSRGPWLARLTEDEFQRFVDRKLRSRSGRAKFLEYVARVRSAQKRVEHLETLRDGPGFDPESPDAIRRLEEAARVSADELEAYIQQLRNEHGSASSELSGLIHDYLDLPAASHHIAPKSELSRATTMSISITTDGPPPMHPSAGISYLRTDAYMDNHANYGPQAQHPVIRARVIRPRHMAQGVIDRAQLGVGGFVTSDPSRANHEGKDKDLVYKLDLETEGGSKVWVHAVNAHVDDRGHVRLSVTRANRAAIEVEAGDFDPSSLAPQMSSTPNFGDLIKMSRPERAGEPLMLSRPTGRRQSRGFDADQVQEIERSIKGGDRTESLESFKQLFDRYDTGDQASSPR